MKKSSLFLALVLLPVFATAQAAKLQLPDLSKLADKAKSSVDISLDGDMLKNAAGFMGGGKGGDNAELNEAMKGLQGVYVKVFEFDGPGMYSMKDIESVVKQVERQGWKKLLSVREEGERVEMWMHENQADGGFFFVASEPNELVMINIVGKVDMAMLSQLQGKMGVPNLPGMAPAPPAPAAPPAAPAPPASAK